MPWESKLNFSKIESNYFKSNCSLNKIVKDKISEIDRKSV